MISVIPEFENLEEYLRIAVMEQDMCYDANPKPSRAVRFDNLTYLGMSYLTAHVEWPDSDSDCKSDHVCPSYNETARLETCHSCSRKIGIEIISFLRCSINFSNRFIPMLAYESATAIQSVKSSVEKASFEVCFPTSLIYGLISRLSVEYGKLISLQGGWTECRQKRYR